MSSSEVVMGAPSATSARTQILSMDMCACSPTRSLQDLQLLEELDDALIAVTLVDHDLAGRSGLGVGDIGDLLAGAGGAHLTAVEAEIGHGQRLHRLRLCRH